ncbi:hypothetical protein [Streptomyces sp. NPDC018693]
MTTTDTTAPDLARGTMLLLIVVSEATVSPRRSTVTRTLAADGSGGAG